MITIRNTQKKIRIPRLRLKNRILRIIRRHKRLTIEQLSVVFMDDAAIRRLNQRFLAKKYPTDVLAFDLRTAPELKMRYRIRGEIIISADTARRNAKEFGTRLDDEIILYIVHGILHLLGYNDYTAREKRQMRLKEQEWLKDNRC